MSQTSTERLRDYLAQLPPQAQALLMREFERAIERGEDVAVATFVLEQLRKVVRGAEEDEEARPRTDDPARLLFRPLEPFLVESNFPVRPGQIRRTSLLPVWQWLGRDGAPDAARAFEAALAGIRQTGTTAGLEAATRKFQLAAAEAIVKIATPGAWRRQAARTGARRSARMSSRTCCRSVRFCGRARRWIRSAAGFPASCGCSRIPRLRR